MPPVDSMEERQPAILVVDDAPESLRFLTTVLAVARMTVLIATDGAAALDLLKRVTPDLILMDAMMPRMDGFEATKRIKANPIHQQLPIIFMTGLTETDDVVRALDAGAVDYVSKPIVVEELLARIRVHLTRARIAYGSQLALDTSGRPALAVDASAGLLWLTPVAGEMMGRLFPGWSPMSGTLPAPFALAIQRMQGGSPAPGACTAVEAGASSLEAIFLRRTPANHWLFRLVERCDGNDERVLAANFGLTLREAEVLLWISRGKQNREVSEILEISPRTVNKHLEQIFEKMGVENRASATAIAVATLAN